MIERAFVLVRSGDRFVFERDRVKSREAERIGEPIFGVVVVGHGVRADEPHGTANGGVAVQTVEQHIATRGHPAAVRSAAEALATLLDGLPGMPGSDGPMTRAALLGLDGREYLRLCRLASAPDAAITAADALFALYMLVSARVKQQSL